MALKYRMFFLHRNKKATQSYADKDYTTVTGVTEMYTDVIFKSQMSSDLDERCKKVKILQQEMTISVIIKGKIETLLLVNTEIQGISRLSINLILKSVRSFLFYFL